MWARVIESTTESPGKKECRASLVYACRIAYASAQKEICPNTYCTPFCVRDMCAECTHPSDFLWVDEEELEKVYPACAYLNLPSFMWYPSGSYKRFDGFMRLLPEKEGPEFAKNIEHQLRSRDVVLH